MDTLLQQLSTLPMSTWIRASAWAFPLMNTGHVIGLALLFGSIAVVDLRLLGAGRSLAAHQLAAFLLPVSILGFALTAVTGALMFLADPAQYWHNIYFPWKLGLIAAAGANAAWLHLTCWRSILSWGDLPPPGALIAGYLSIVLWTGVIICGRLMAYF